MAESGKFKLKPKVAVPPPPEAASGASSVPPPVAVPPGVPAKAMPPPPATAGAAEGAAKALPPFPVVAPPKSGKTTPPIPHISMPTEVTDPAAAVPPPPGKKRRRKLSPVMLGGVAAALLAVVGGGGFYFYQKFTEPPPPPPIVVRPKPTAPKPAVVAPAAPLTPSETLNAVAHAPANAINKAQEAVIAQRLSEQARVDGLAAGEEPVDPKSAAPAKAAVQTSSAIAPGISATNDSIESAGEATPAFRSFVANAKVSGVFQGSPPRVMFNNRLTRAGDTVDAALGITFDSIDPARKLLLFKDKSGATGTRRY